MLKHCQNKLKRKIGVLGATGSIGLQTMEVLRLNKEAYEIVFISAHRNEDLLNTLAREFSVDNIFLTNEGYGALTSFIKDTELDLVLVGSSGTEILSIVHLLASRGTWLAIANKECLVAGGEFIKDAVESSGGFIIPVDSEHSAIFQSIGSNKKHDITKVTLTASGGAFRDIPLSEMANITVEQALKHPNWQMGNKITIDSATMMNKGLELLEAKVLFDLDPNQLCVAIHPQSVVHSLVSYCDGSTIAQLGIPDMRTAISYALSYPSRIKSGVEDFDFTKFFELTFYPPDLLKYPCLKIALEVLHSSSISARIAMNASNEVAVQAFLSKKIKYTDIFEIVEKILNSNILVEPSNINEVIEIDLHFRTLASYMVNKKK